MDSIGLAGFSHNFEALDGKHPPVVTALDSFGDVKQSIPTMLMLFLGQLFPSLLIKFPTERLKTIKNISSTIGSLVGGIIDSARVDKEADVWSDKSIIGTLGKVD
jgi:hypothetical protein